MTLIVLSIIVAAGFILTGAVKVRMIPMAVATTRRLGIRYQQYRLIGAVEIIFAVMVLLGIWIGWMGSLGTLVLTLIAAVTILAHARVADAPKEIIAPAVLGILSFVLFLVHIYQ